jgi:hypothetical protein
MSKTEQIYDNLIQNLRIITSDSNVQIALFPEFVNIADEIALLYNDVYITVPILVTENLISSIVYDILTQIDRLLDSMSQDKSLWNIEMLEKNKYWQELRYLAYSALRELKEPYVKPNLEFVNWIR